MRLNVFQRFCFVFIILIAICLSGCVSNNNFTSSESKPTINSTKSSTLYSSNSEVQPLLSCERKVGFVFSGNVNEETSFTNQTNLQRIMASNREGIDTCYVDNVNAENFENAINELKNNNCTDVFLFVSDCDNALAKYSESNPNMNFIYHGTHNITSNISTFSSKVQQGGYIAGLMASFNSETHNIGFVGDERLINNNAVANSIRAGSRLCRLDDQIFFENAHTNNDIESKIDLLIGENCDVIVCYTETSYSEEYCQQKGIKFIGSHDFSGKLEQFPDMLMYFYCRYDSYFLHDLKIIQEDNRCLPADYVGTIKDGTMSVSSALVRSKKDSQKIMDAIITSFSSDVPLLDDQGRNRNEEYNDLTSEEKAEIRKYIQSQYCWYDTKEGRNTEDTYTFEIWNNATNKYGLRDGEAKALDDLYESRKKEEEELFITSLKGVHDGNYFIVSGNVENNSSSTVKFVVVKIELIDEKGKVFDSDTTFAVGEEGIRPGNSAKFKCYFDNDDRLENYSANIFSYD